MVAEGVVSQSDAEQAELYAKRRRVHVEEALLESGLMDEGQLLRFQAALYRTYFVSTKKLSLAPISDSLLRLVTQRLAARLWIFPVKYDARTGELSILTVEPDDPDVLKGVQFATRVSKVRALVARPAAIAAAIRQHFMNEVGAFAAVRHTGDKYGTADDRSRRMPDAMPAMAEVGSTPPISLDRGDAKRTTGQHAAPVATVSMLPHQMPHQPIPQPAAFGGPQNLAYQTLTGVDAKMLGVAPAAAYQTLSGADTKMLGLGGPMATPAQPIPAPAPVAPSIAMHDFVETLNVVVALLEQDRGELRGHSMMVVRIARRMCERLGLTPEETDSIVIASYLHDLGKVSQFHLTALNVAQYENHRAQAKKSYLTPMRLFEAVRLPDKVATVLAHMYERLDGQGFPDRLSA
ncbi:MAG TPA: HD domain-containing phosphohydrolase, partial [Polyangiales bacterium]|nr:HD domain-containing phosphohydrolase [Polyangiales bacterium]